MPGSIVNVTPCVCVCVCVCVCLCIYIYIYGFQNVSYVVRHLDAIASCLPTGLHFVVLTNWSKRWLKMKRVRLSAFQYPSVLKNVFVAYTYIATALCLYCN
jgi:hypothetical protein